MDAVTLGMARADAKKKYAPLGGALTAAWIGDSLTANGFVSGAASTGQYVGTLQNAASVGATALSVLYPYTATVGFANVTPPQANAALVIEPGTVREEYILPSAVTGSGPYALTTPALQFAHPAGAEIRGYTRWFNSQSVPMWLSLLSGGAIQFGEIYAHGGYTTQQIRDIYLPQLLSAKEKPGIVFLCAGTNDVPASAASDIPASVMTTELEMIDTIRKTGSILVVVGMAPDASNPAATAVARKVRFNLRLAHECRKRGVLYVDVFSGLVDDGSGVAGPNSYKTRLNLDNTHPNDIGAKAWAQILWNAVSSAMIPRAQVMGPPTNTMADATVYPFATNNAVMLTDTNADGIPDGWTKSQGTAGDTVALETVAGGPGKMLSITRAANGATDPILQYQTFTLTPGARYKAQLRVGTSGVDAAYDAHATTSGTGGGLTTTTFLGFDIRCMANTGQIDLVSLRGWRRDISMTTVEIEFVVPPGISNTTILWQIRLRGTSTTPAYTVKVQPFLVNLTALGV